MEFGADGTLAEYHGKQLHWKHHGRGSVAFEANRIRQVLLNLTVNAINAMGATGHIRVESLVSDSIWQLTVEDDGPGLTADQREKIFDRFVRFKPSSNDKGSGLGLAISRSIVKLHRGTIVALVGEGERGLRMVIEIPHRSAL